MEKMDFKSVKPDFLLALWIAVLIFLFGITYLLADMEKRLGTIEHYLAHSVSTGAAGCNSYGIGER